MVSKDGTVIEVPAAIMKARRPLTIVLAGPGLEPVAAELRKLFRRNGDAIFYTVNHRSEWHKACDKVGLGVRDPKTRSFDGARMHDLRCSAAINLVDAGVSEDMVMKIGGWSTKAMFRGTTWRTKTGCARQWRNVDVTSRNWERLLNRAVHGKIGSVALWCNG
jgi:hypothetical protein